MTPRQRVLAVLRGQLPDKAPFTIYKELLPRNLGQLVGVEELCIIVRNTPAYLEHRPNCATRKHKYVENGRVRLRTTIHTPSGELSRVEELAERTTWTIEYFFKRPEDYAALRYWLAEGVEFTENYDAVLHAEKEMGDHGIARGEVGPCPLHNIMVHLMGIERFAIEWTENRDEVVKLAEAIASKQRDLFSLVARAPITHANFGGNETPEVMGPPRHMQYCLPLLNECAEVFHKEGKLLSSHRDGNNRRWAAALRDSALDIIEAFTPAPDTDMTLAEALDAWPDKILWVNFPSSLHLADIATIKKAAREIVEFAQQTNRVVLGITEDMPSDRARQNLRAISEVINET